MKIKATHLSRRILFGFGFLAAISTYATDIAGPAIVTGGSNGTLDADGPLVSFGTIGTAPGISLIFSDSSATSGTTGDTLTFSANRTSASWLWLHNASKSAMRLTDVHQLLLYQADGLTAGITLTPASNRLSLGSATLTGSGVNLLAGGGLTVASGITNTNGSLTGGASGLTLNAGGTNQNITLTPSGTGYTMVQGSARFTGGGTFGYTANVGANNGLILGTVAKASVPSGGQGSIQINSNDASNPFQGFISLITDATASNRRLAIGTVEQNVAWRNITLAESGGNVGIGTSTPNANLDVSGTVRVGGNRPITFNGGTGMIQGQGDAGGWAFGYHTKGSSGTDKGGFGFYGSADLLNYYYIGSSYSNPSVIAQPNNGSVGIGVIVPTEKLEVAGAIKSSGAVVGMSRLVLQSTAVGGQQYEWYNDFTGMGGGVLGLYNRTSNNNPLAVTSSGNVGIGNANPAFKLDVNGHLHVTSGNFLHNSVHGDYEMQQLLAANNGAGTGDAALYSWVSEPGVTWTGAGIARNMRNSGSGFPRVNTGLSGQMIRFDEGAGIWFTTETATGTRYTPMYLSGNDMIVSGNVGIGTANPGAYKLAVLGSIRANAVVVDTGWSDYVFDQDYRLAPLSEVEAHIKEHKHLPGIPSAAEVAEHGVSLGDMQSKLLAKIEELTLRQIAQEKDLSALKTENAELKREVSQLKVISRP